MTDNSEVHTEPAVESSAAHAPGTAPAKVGWKAPALIAAGVLGALAIGAVGGWAITSGQLAPQIDSLQRDNDDLAAELTKMTADRDRLSGEQEQVITDYTDKLAEVSAAEAGLKEREEAVKAREDKIAIVEASSFTAGMLLVGTDVTPGTYRTTGVSDCYYAWMSGTGSDADIIDNNIVSGTATVTLKKGDIFESSTRCGTWTKVG